VSFHLAQVNLAYGLAPVGDPLLADFVARIDEINALAERSPGFIWRYRSDGGYPQEFGDSRVLFNMSVWESVEALHAFTYRTDHAELYAARKKWFGDVKASLGLVGIALWWIPAGELPTVADSKQRLVHLTEHGPAAHAFTFKQRFSPKGVKLAHAKIA
jgi:hypothetical protein